MIALQLVAIAVLLFIAIRVLPRFFVSAFRIRKHLILSPGIKQRFLGVMLIILLFPRKYLDTEGVRLRDQILLDGALIFSVTAILLLLAKFGLLDDIAVKNF